MKKFMTHNDKSGQQELQSLSDDDPIIEMLEITYRCLESDKRKHYPFYSTGKCLRCDNTNAFAHLYYWYSPRSSMKGDCKTCKLVLFCHFGGCKFWANYLYANSNIILVANCPKCGRYMFTHRR